MMYAKLCEHPKGHWKRYVNIIFSFIFSVVGFAAATISFLGLIGVLDLT